MDRPDVKMNCDPDKSWFFPGSNRFNLESRSMVQTLFRQYPSDSCEFNFVNLFCWEQVYNYSWFIHEGRLVIYDGVNQCIFMPLGKPVDPKSLYALSCRFADMGLSPNICLATESYIEAYPFIDRFYGVQEDRDAAEYIYLAKSLAALKGSKLHKKRNLISQFKRRYPDYRTKPITGTNRAEVKQFTRDLLETMDPIPKSLAEEFCAMEKAFDHWEQLDIQGLVVSVEDKIAAFSIFSPLNFETYNIHFEKSNIAFKGAAQVINQETALFLAEKTKYINREQDLGIPGLRQAKLSYEPHHLLTPRVLTWKPNPDQ